MELMTRSCAVLVTMVMLGGCGAGGAKTFKKFNIDKGDSIAIDATTRVILVTQKGGATHDQFVVCGEPSPDAIVASFGAEATVKATVPQGPSGALSGEISQTAKSIAVRTATIQLLRDGLYRSCEAVINGMIGPSEYLTILKGIDDVMVVLQGIDSLGGLKDGGVASANSIQVIVLKKLEMQ
ncbi:MAG: hypothetical protein O7G83_08340 [Proteobacteria bacterium]|nr:hypothetical protein [Pseudomonadota bacterium]